jgi:hypothetical protein
MSNPNLFAVGGKSIYVSNDGGRTWEERGNGLGATSTQIGTSSTQDEIYLKEELCFLACDEDEIRFFKFNLSTSDSELVSTQGCGSNPSSEWEESLCHGYLDGQPGYFLSPINPDIAYINNGSSLDRTNDGGSTWESCDSWPFGYVSEMKSAVALHPEAAGILYVATSDGIGITRDGCSTWIEPKGLDTRHINSVALNPENTDIVYAGTDAGVYISYDAGDTWGKVNDGLLGALVIYSISIDPLNPDNVYASTPYGIFKLEGK